MSGFMVVAASASLAQHGLHQMHSFVECDRGYPFRMIILCIVQTHHCTMIIIREGDVVGFTRHRRQQARKKK